jgi:hypothetical protein
MLAYVPFQSSEIAVLLELLAAEREAKIIMLSILNECSIPKAELRYVLGERINAVEAMTCRIEAICHKVGESQAQQTA